MKDIESKVRDAQTLLHSNASTIGAKDFALFMDIEIGTAYTYLRGMHNKEPFCPEQFGNAWSIPRQRIYEWIHPSPVCQNPADCIEGALKNL